MVRKRFVVEGRHFEPSGRRVEGEGFRENSARLEARNLCATPTRACLERLQQTAAESESAHGRRYPHALDLRRRVDVMFDRTAPERLAVDVHDEKPSSRRPDFVRAVIVEDAPAVVAPRPEILSDLAGRFSSLRALREAASDDTFLLESAFEDDDGWGFRFDPAAINRSRTLLAGDHWADWLASSHPLLLMRGGESDFLPRPLAAEMAARRPHTRLVEFPDAGHHIHDDDPAGFAAAVRSFLAEI